VNVLIIGGRGFIGRKLVAALVLEGYKITVLTRLQADHLNVNTSAITFMTGDLLDQEFNFDKVIEHFEVIYNCAGEILNESLMYSLHVEATRRLVDSCKKVARKRNHKIHWIQLSSIGVYGSSQLKANTERIVTEETRPSPVGKYEVTKTLADEIIVKAADELFSFSILRPSNVYGAEMPNNSIRQLAMMIKKGLFFYIGRPNAISNYVHVDDVVDALVLCGFDPRAKDQVFNLSNDCDQTVVINALAEGQSVSSPTIRLNESFVTIIAFMFSWFPKFPLKKSRIDALVSRTHYDISKIKRVLGFSPSRDVNKTIVELL